MKATKFHPLVNVLLFGTFLSRIALFITLPYLSIYIHSKMGATPTMTGIVVGLGPLCGIINAFLMGFISDKIGRRKILEYSLVAWSLAFLGFAFSSSLWQFAICNMLYGASRSSFESVATAFLSDISDTTNRKKIFHLRYFFINLAASIAPLIGLWILLKHPSLGFGITSAVYLIYFVLLNISMNKWPVTAQQDKKPITLGSVFKVISSDRSLQLFMFGNILMLLGFSQLETNLPQYLNQLFGNEGVKLYSYVMMTNGLTIVCCQFLINKMFQKMDLAIVSVIGFFIFALGMSSVAFFEEIPKLFILSMFIISIGEILVFSNSYLLIDQLGPAHLKGSYFGITELCNLGFVLGPSLGGIILENAGGPTMFIFMASLSLISIWMFLYGNRLYQQRTRSA